MQPHPKLISIALQQGEARAAWELVRWQLRFQSSKLRHRHDGRYVPGHAAMALGRALELFARQEDPRAMRPIVRLAHKALRTLPCHAPAAPARRRPTPYRVNP